jgi:UDP-GlcNAc:undecaprenyl-phosphate/decaprenyl-phosphate GlcNAc-1-phosphate transferase
MNGLTSGLSLILLSGLAIMFHEESPKFALYILAISAVLAFFIRNYFIGKIFMGDQGSQLLGFLVGALACEQMLLRGSLESMIPTICLPLLLSIFFFPFIFDTILVVWIRKKEGRPWYVGDQSHLSHQLVKRGKSPFLAVFILLVFQSICFGLGILALYAFGI